MKQKELFVSLKSKSDIRDIFTRGEKVKSKYLLIRYLKFDTPLESPIQVVWAIPRIVETAVKRNYIKRILKSSLFEVLKTAKSKNFSHSTLKIAIIPRLEYSTLSQESREIDMHDILNKLFEKTGNAFKQT